MKKREYLVIIRPDELRILQRLNGVLVDYQAEKMGENYTWQFASEETKWSFKQYRKAFYMVEVLMCLIHFKGPLYTEAFFGRIHPPSSSLDPDKDVYLEVCAEIYEKIQEFIALELTQKR